MNRAIKKVAILGSGIMGSRIACHFANIGVEVLLLDIVPRELDDKEKLKGLTIENKIVRNRIVNDALKSTLKSNPSPIYKKEFASLITTGNFDDDMPKIKDADWVMEVVVERLDIKKIVFDNVVKYRKQGSLITSNTSGIPINMMITDRDEDFQKHFCGTHFFNPPRYLKLFEVIPTKKTDTKIVEFLMNYGEQYLGKTSVLAKDTPAFIANRVGIYSIMELFHVVKEMGLTIEEVDKLTGPVIGRAKSATFRTVDVVGLDTLVHVANGLYKGVPNDEAHDLFAIPKYVETMMENGWLGSKSKQGFYKKTVNAEGKKEILSLDLDTLEYRSKKGAKFATLEMTKSIDKVIDRFKVLVKGKDKAGEFYRKTFSGLFQYVSNRIPEISDELYKIDDGMKAGFGWKHGPFQVWDAIGVEKGIKMMEAEGKKPAQWVYDMVEKGQKSFYSINNGTASYYDIPAKENKIIPGLGNFIILDNTRATKTIWQNSGSVIQDLGDGILNVEFTSKMNTIGGEVLQGIQKAIDLSEKEYRGLVIGNQGENFSVGANLAMIFMMAIEQEYDELNFAIKQFQDTMMRVRYSSIPVVVAPHGMTFGGGAEMTLHADKVVAAAETYMGLVEFGVGVIPGGGGSKEFTLRASDSFKKGDVEVNALQEAFLTIAMAKVATSGHEAYDLGFLKKGRDHIVVNKDRQIATAKRHAIIMAEDGYTKPVERKDIKVLGRQVLGMFNVGTDSMVAGKYISEHDRKIADKLAYVMAGGDLSEKTLVSEQYLLDLEREAFLSLTTEKKTLERIQHMLKTGKPLRN
ncbi:MAG: enoyl-CoA hydratase/isomerase family protein [Ichthyobacteriaceae bacterium]|nr:enoyl-CoA hydratase/isomerase family protein [Ichthyobacteriaceae bacterium]